ncbi:MAG: adenine deaminase [Anaerolineaceae bacterium]|nr:adenine deaminase [Anaerolineaceae bacterium]
MVDYSYLPADLAEKARVIETGLRETFDVIKGKKPADLLMKNLRIVDVYLGDCYDGSLLIHGGRIVALNPDEAAASKALEVFDGRGMYAIPGFIDCHVHVDTEMVTPDVLAQVITPRGTTAMIAEYLDFASASKDKGVDYTRILFQQLDKLPYRLYLEAPGKKVSPGIVAEMLQWDSVFALGELNHYKYIAGTPDTFEVLALAKLFGKRQNAHARWANSPMEFNLFPALGSTAGHDAFTYEDLLMDMRAGHLTVLRQGSGVLKNVSTLMPQVIDNGLPIEHLAVCTDGVSLEYKSEHGHMDSIVQTIINMGLHPIEAIKMATINPAIGMHLEGEIGSLTPGRYADVVLVKDIYNVIKPEFVFKGGRLVAKDGKLTQTITGFDYIGLRSTRGKGLTDLMLDDVKVQTLDVSEDGMKALVRVFNENLPREYDWYEDLWLDTKDGEPVLGSDMSRLWVIQRYPSAGQKRHVISTYTKDYVVSKGAFSITNQSPASYIAVVGRDVEDMMLAAHAADQEFGCYAACLDGQIKSALNLPLAGVLSDITNSVEFIKQVKGLAQLGKDGGFVDDMGWFRQLMMLFWKLDRNQKLVI